MRDAARRVANRIIRLYPRPWRRRYGAEMQAVLEQMPVRWRQVADLAGGATREWMSPRAFGWPARSAAGRILFVRGVTYVSAAYAIDGLARLIAWKLNPSAAEIPESVGISGAMLSTVAMLRLCLALGLHRKKGLSPRLRRLSHLTPFETGIWCVAMLSWLIVEHAQPMPEYIRNPGVSTAAGFIKPYVLAWMAFQASRRTTRLTLVQSSHLRRKARLYG